MHSANQPAVPVILLAGAGSYPHLIRKWWHFQTWKEVGWPSVERFSCYARFVCDLVGVASGAFSTPTPLKALELVEKGHLALLSAWTMDVQRS